MIFETLEAGPLQTNCYIVGDEKTREAAVIDPGGDAPEIIELLSGNGLTCKYIIITHAHFDHVGGCAELKQKTGARLVIHAIEEEMLPVQSGMAMMFGMKMKNPPPADMTVKEGDVIKVGSIEMKVIHTPGHSPGSICLLIHKEKIAIVGDLLFQGSIGRTDFPGCSHEKLLEMVRTKVFPLGDDWKVYPGHGPATTVGIERKHNPFF